MGTMPTTSAIAGTVNGIRQMNSITRLRPGNLSRTHTIVGSSRTSIAIQVIAASSREAVIASVRSGVWTMFFHASRLRGAVSALPRVENSNIAPMGTRKNAPRTRKTIARNSWSLRRRDLLISSSQPVRGAPLKQRVERHHDQNDQDHGQRKRLGEPRLDSTRLAGQKVRDLQRHDDTTLGDQGSCRRVRGERVRKEQQRAAEKRRREERTGHVAPVVPG